MKPTNKPNPDGLMRLNRYLSRAGFGSRRGVEQIITSGRVTVDGEIVTELSCRVDPATQTVTLDGERIKLSLDTRVYAFHKPIGIVCTMRPQGEQIGLEAFPARSNIPTRFKPMGRLDQDSSGLLLWTDDGVLAQDLMKPDSEVWKTYEVLLVQRLDKDKEDELAAGTIVLDGRPVRKCKVIANLAHNRRRWTLQLHEGRKRQIRRMFAAVGAKVLHLKRVAVGPVELGRLKEGDFRRLTPEEEKELRSLV